MARKQRNHSRRGPRQHPEVDDGLQDWSDWLDHQYVPGYYVGGRIPPFLRRTGRANSYGYVLTVVGAVTLLGMIVAVVKGAGLSLPGSAVGVVIAALEVGAGLRLARGRR